MMPTLHRRRPAPPCQCWIGGGPAWALCTGHQRAVAEAILRDADTMNQSAVALYGATSERSHIDMDRPDSATPGPVKDRQVQS